MQRTDKRNFDQLREISITPTFNIHAEGSALTKFGNTHVICTASIEEKVPIWLRGKQKQNDFQFGPELVARLAPSRWPSLRGLREKT